MRSIADALQSKVLVIDGAMGTVLQGEHLTAADFGGPHLEGCNEHLVLTRPDVISKVHHLYLDAGADIIETNTFGGTPVVLDEYGLGAQYDIINQTAARLAREAADKVSTPDHPRFVAGSIGPTTKAISVTGGITFDALIDNFYKQAVSLIQGGVDLLLIETCQDTRNIKAALLGIDAAFRHTNKHIPLMVSATIEPTGTMLAGQDVSSLIVSLAHAPLLSIGLNCATGPEFMTDHIRTLHEMSPWAVSCYPNAGLPDENGLYPESPAQLATKISRFLEKGWINIIGGCCGTTPAHIRAISDVAKHYAPRRKPSIPTKTWFSGIEAVEANDDNRPLIVGERTNVIGSRKFKEMVMAGQWDEAVDIACRQIKNGAQIIDVCLQTTDVDEKESIVPFYERLTRRVKAPIMIDTTDSAAIELALRELQGKAIINSINLEDGEEKFEKIVPIVKRFGAAVIVGCIDEDPNQAQAITRDRKLAIAQRSFDLLTGKYGVSPSDIIFDPLVFPCATGDENYVGSAAETIEGIRLIKQHLPLCKTVLGVSNVSFGLPASAREVVNSVFLYHATKAGLDLAIVNSEKIERFADISDTEKKLAEKLLFDHDPATNKINIATITEHFRNTTRTSSVKTTEHLPLDERLAQYIVHGTKDGLIPDLDEKLKTGTKPLDIINGPLMTGMGTVGKLFNNNELIVAEVLQSAEVMKAAVDYLEPRMEKADITTKGTLLLATVKGDVHDIGKNLVEIIFKNNGFTVINLGIKVPPDQLISACREHSPDMIGLSGLLVKSAQQMAITAADLKSADISVPMLVGGAALTEKFTITRIAPEYAAPVYYAKDAMNGLAIANAISSGEAPEVSPTSADVVTNPLSKSDQEVEPTTRSRAVATDIPLPAVADTDRHICDLAPHLRDIWELINPQMLYVKHLGLRGNFAAKLAEGDAKATQIHQRVEEVKDESAHLFAPKGVWQFFEVSSEGNTIHIHDHSGTIIHHFHFRRQKKEDGLSLADYILPSQTRDHIALFAVTAGKGIRELAEAYKEKGDYLKSHIIQALAIETAEAAAEWIHRDIRAKWGFADAPTLTPKDLFGTRYRGKRYSFGYPACPNLDDQVGIWKLINPTEIGIELTEGMMMEPEASVSAIVFHHPDCIYFGVGE